MSTLNELVNNFVLAAALISWLSAQVLKTLFYLIRNKKFSLERLIGSGGMPSSHTSTVCGLATAVARYSGLSSPLFAISIILACVVMYDAAGVRRAAGEQAKILNQLIEREDDLFDAQKALKELLGHTPLEVLGGAVLGITIAFILPMPA